MVTREVVADRERALAFCNEFYPLSGTPAARGLCLTRGEVTLAATVYDEFNGSNMMMHVAATPGRRWLNRHFLHEAFKYPFVTCGATRLTSPVSSTNEDANRFVKHLGFRCEAVLERAGEHGQDVFLYVMFREDCRYA